MTRACGECSECCFGLYIQQLDKKPLTWCEHACASSGGVGCAIYQDRPSVCRDYHCAWKEPGPLADVLGDEQRPDRVGVIFQVVAVGAERAMEAIASRELTAEADALIARVSERTGVVSLGLPDGTHEMRTSPSGFGRVIRLHAAARREAELAAIREQTAQEGGADDGR